jgi:hypothetical protein
LRFSVKSIKKPQHMLGFCDLDWIQTSNLLSRNQVRYSVAPQGHIVLQIIVFINLMSACLRVQR